MDRDTAMCITFMFVGLGFFLLVIFVIIRDSRETQDRYDRRSDVGYNRRWAEKKEFGYIDENMHTVYEPITRKKK